VLESGRPVRFHATATVSCSRGDDGDTVTGTIWTRQPISGPGTPYVCESGRVTFSAQPQR
jgi:hypothetical protein